MLALTIVIGAAWAVVLATPMLPALEAPAFLLAPAGFVVFVGVVSGSRGRSVVGLFVTAVLSAALAVVLRGSFIHVLLVAAAVPAFVAVLLLLITDVILQRVLSSAEHPREMGNRPGTYAVILAGLLFLIPSLVGGNLLLQQDIEKAKLYCEALVPLLEEHCDRKGQYPETLEELEHELAPPPRLLKSSGFYTSGVTESGRSWYSFYLPSATSALGCHSYDSRSHHWNYSS